MHSACQVVVHCRVAKGLSWYLVLAMVRLLVMLARVPVVGRCVRGHWKVHATVVEARASRGLNARFTLRARLRREKET